MTDNLLVPLPCHYAAIRLNPTAMLKDLRLDDAITLAEAEKFKPKTYLAFLLWPEELPLPGMRWCRYSVEPIGATLRTPIQEQGITSDMVIPIAPNDSHPRGRIPVHPSPSFPFANCFHWIESNVTVRIRVREDGFAHDRAVSLSAEEHVALMRRFEEDYERIGNFYAEQEAQIHHCSLDNPQNLKTQTTAASQAGGAQQFTQGVSDEHLSAAYLRYAREEGMLTSIPMSDSSAGWEFDSDLGRGSRVDGAPASPTSTSDDDFVDVFGRAPDPTTGLIPLVDAWMDIDQHLSADSIPSPDELENEVEEMIQIIKRGVARRLLAEKAGASIGRVEASPRDISRFSKIVPPHPVGCDSESSQSVSVPTTQHVALWHPVLWSAQVGLLWSITGYFMPLVRWHVGRGAAPLFHWLGQAAAKACTC